MSTINFLLSRNQQSNYVPHHRNYLYSNLTDFEKDLCYSFEILTYPVIRLKTVKPTHFRFKHTDTRFRPNQDFQPYIEMKKKTLAYNEMYHIRCKSMNIADNTIVLETKWNDFSQFLGTNMMIGSNDTIREMVKKHYPISSLLAKRLYALSSVQRQ